MAQHGTVFVFLCTPILASHPGRLGCLLGSGWCGVSSGCAGLGRSGVAGTRVGCRCFLYLRSMWECLTIRPALSHVLDAWFCTFTRVPGVSVRWCSTIHQGAAFSHLYHVRMKCFAPVLIQLEVLVGCLYPVPQLPACRELGRGLVYSPQWCVEILKHGETVAITDAAIAPARSSSRSTSSAGDSSGSGTGIGSPLQCSSSRASSLSGSSMIVFVP